MSNIELNQIINSRVNQQIAASQLKETKSIKNTLQIFFFGVPLSIITIAIVQPISLNILDGFLNLVLGM